MKAPRAALTRVRAAWAARCQAWSAKLQAVPTKDRYALWAAAAALAVGAELAVVDPMQQKAARIAQATLAQIEEAQAQQEAARRSREEQRQALEQRLAAARRMIEGHGVMQSGAVSAAQATAAVFADARVRVLRVTSDVTPLQITPDSDPATAAQRTDATSDATAQPTLYVHRLEVELAGTPPALLQAARTLERSELPWRVQGVGWRRGTAPGEAIAVCTLVIESTEAAWLRL